MVFAYRLNTQNSDKLANRNSTGVENVNGDEVAANSFKIISEISDLLNTGLDSDQLLTCVKLIESGINPTALAMLVHNVKQECQQAMDNMRK